MDLLRVGSLNINAGRDSQKRVLVSEIMQDKKLHVILLQETQRDMDNKLNGECGGKVCMYLAMAQI